MKKFLLLIILFFAISLSAQVTITMEQDGGVYKVPCKVNGAKMKFIFDTGAATVCLSETMAKYLLENDYITRDDILGSGKSQVADGRIVDHVRINIRDIEIAGLHINDIEASVVEGQNAPLLLGQTAIQKLGIVSIKGNKLIISRDPSLTNSKRPNAEFSENAEYELYTLEKKLESAKDENDTIRISVLTEEYYMYHWKYYEKQEKEKILIAWWYLLAQNYPKVKYWLSQVNKEDLDDFEPYYYILAEYYFDMKDYSRSQFYYSKVQDETLEPEMWQYCERKIKQCQK